MADQRPSLTAKQTFWLILLPLLATWVGQRSYLHLVRVRHVYPGGYLVHHLFIGVLLIIPAAFVLAFGPKRRAVATVALAALGIGSAMALDEMVYLVMTKATDGDYVSPLSLHGAMLFIAAGVTLLCLVYRLNRD